MENNITTGTVTIEDTERAKQQNMAMTSNTSSLTGVTVTAPYVVEPDPHRMTAPELRPQHEYQREIDKLKKEKQELRDEIANLHKYIEEHISNRHQIIKKDDILNRYAEIDTTKSSMYIVDLVGATVSDFDFMEVPELRAHIKDDECVCILDKGPDDGKKGAWL